MSIELLPRARVVTAWPAGPHSTTAALPARAPFEGGYAVQVPVAPRPAVDRVRPPRYVFFFAFWWFGIHILQLLRWWLLGVVAFVALLVAYRSLRLPRLLDRRDADVWLTPDYVASGRLRVPWWQVEGVVRLRVGNATNGHSFLALQVRDFVAVRGLTPFWAGLANLTRRRLVVLARTDELANPESFARALDRLVARPEERLLLSGETGAQLVRDA